MLDFKAMQDVCPLKKINKKNNTFPLSAFCHFSRFLFQGRFTPVTAATPDSLSSTPPDSLSYTCLHPPLPHSIQIGVSLVANKNFIQYEYKFHSIPMRLRFV